jgi:hypothetical protein
MSATNQIMQHVSGAYKVGGDPQEKPLHLAVRVAVLEHYQGQTAEHLLRRVDQLIRAFEQAA